MSGDSMGMYGETSSSRPDSGRARVHWSLVLAAALAVVLSLVWSPGREAPDDTATWIVSGTGTFEAVIDAIDGVGAQVLTPLPVIGGVSARLSSGQARLLAADPGISSVVRDGSLSLSTWNAGPPSDEGSLHRITSQVLRADRFWSAGFTGDGVDVAIIDSGLTPVEGTNDSNRVVYGPDLSFDSPQENLRYLDLYGHGTHMASIIAGSDTDAPAPGKSDRSQVFRGVAPGSRILSVKVADGVGRADVSQVIAAINWVVEHRNSGDLDIRVLALAFGTDGVQAPQIDPLAHAVESAWRNGIVVVVAAGNDGNGAPVRNPATDPYVIAVGAVETQGTYGAGDDTVLDFSNCGTDSRTVDLLAPGKSVLGLRVPGSYIDDNYPEAVVQDRYFRGSGTSQATAVAAGAAALVIDQRPELTPDQVKALLVENSNHPRNAPAGCGAAGAIDLLAAFKAPTPDAVQSWPESTGTGSIEAARGTHHVSDGDGNLLEGEVDIFGAPWDALSWSAATTAGTTWQGGVWNGNEWAGDGWSSKTWSSKTWSSKTWSSKTWSSKTWSTTDWSSKTWSESDWSSKTWSDAEWTGATWSSKTWSSKTWSSKTWSDGSWSGNVSGGVRSLRWE